MERICFKPIGVVRIGLPEPGEGGERLSKYEYVSTIEVYREYVDGLRGLDEYSHCIIIWFMDRAGKAKLLGRPWGDESLPYVGIFATRFPSRPNPIGLTVTEIVEVSGRFLRVRGLDAWSGSPILDIKPYDYYDIVRKPRVPSWFRARWERWYREKRYGEAVPWLGPYE